MVPSSFLWHGASSFPPPPSHSGPSQRTGPAAGYLHRPPARDDIKDEKTKLFSGRGLSAGLCTIAHTHLCAVALAAEVGARGPDGLRGGAAVVSSGAVRY